jgi:hypothetical protein
MVELASRPVSFAVTARDWMFFEISRTTVKASSILRAMSAVAAH